MKRPPKITNCANGQRVEHWFDRKSKNFIVQVTDVAGNQIGDAEISGATASRNYDVEQLVKANGGKCPHVWAATTDGTNRPICRRCGEYPGKAECEYSREGLMTHVAKEGVEVFNVWKSAGLQK